MNEQIAIELWRRPTYDGGTVEYTSLFKGYSYHVPRKDDVVTLEEETYIVHEVAWNFSVEQGLESVDVYLTYDGAL